MQVLLSAAGAAQAVNAANRSRYTPLHNRAASEFPEQCRLLLEAKADINAVNHINMTPLMIAVENARLDNVNLFLAHEPSPDLSVVNMHGYSAVTLVSPISITPWNKKSDHTTEECAMVVRQWAIKNNKKFADPAPPKRAYVLCFRLLSHTVCSQRGFRLPAWQNEKLERRQGDRGCW